MGKKKRSSSENRISYSIKLADEKYLRGILARLTRQHEAQQPVPWKMGDAPQDFMRDQLSKIAAVEIEIISMVGKFKVSQNRSSTDAERKPFLQRDYHSGHGLGDLHDHGDGHCLRDTK